jgi:predicted ATPase/DNA-binding SARP family transcriptional activator
MKPASDSPELCLRLIGPVSVYVGGVPMRKLRTRAGIWLLALLALRRGKPAARGWLAETLWPESMPTTARDNLRRCLSDLRGALGGEAGRITSPSGETLRFDVDDTFVDVFEYDAALEGDDAEDIARATAVTAGALLKDVRAPWAEQEREARRGRYCAALDRWARPAGAQRNAARACDLTRRLLNEEPLNEDVAVRLMDLLAAAGERDAALVVYRELRARLFRTVRESPASATTVRYYEIRSAARREDSKPESVRRSSDHPRIGSVPYPSGPLVGRDRATAELLACLDRARIVTVTGTGGIGKTRLAVNVAHEAWQDYADGVWFVDLAPVRSEAEILAEIAAVLGIALDGDSSEETLVRALHARDAMLLLDNCEHLRAETAQLARRIIERCPNVHILATSRKSLGLSGETVWRVPPLTCSPPPPGPSDGARSSMLESYMAESAFELFATRAKQFRSDFKLTLAAAPGIAGICVALDGNPLAIELAAAWIRSLSVKQILHRLNDPFDLLTGGARAGAHRETLDAVVDRSFSLLTPEERRLWCEMSVFAGGCTLDALESVWSTPGAPGRLVHMLDRLVDASVVVHEERDGETRYYLPGALRQFGAARHEPEAKRDTAHRHLAYFAQWVESMAPGLVGAGQTDSLARLDRDRANLRLALEHARDEGAGELGLGLSSSLWRFWHARGASEIGQEWLETFLRMTTDLPPAQRLKAVGAAGNLAFRRSDYANARRHFREHLKLSRLLGLDRGVASALGNLANVASDESKLTEAHAYYDQSLEAFRAIDDPRGMAFTFGNLAIVAGREGNHSLACEYHESSIGLFREQGDLVNLALALANQAETRLQSEEYALAPALLVESLQIGFETGNLRNVAQCVLVACALAVRQELYEEGAVLVGVLDRLRAVTEMPVVRPGFDRCEDLTASLLARLGPYALSSAATEGSGMTDAQVIETVRRLGP